MIPPLPVRGHAQASLLNMEQIARLLGGVVSSLALQAEDMDDVRVALEVSLQSWPLVLEQVISARAMLDKLVAAGNVVPPGPVQ